MAKAAKTSGDDKNKKSNIDKINDTTYKIKYTDYLEVEIGDASISDNFKPHIKIKKWDAEVEFELEFDTTKIKTAIETGQGDESLEKLEWDDDVAENIRIVIYPLDKQDRMEEGGTEYEFIFSAPPPSNEIVLDFTSKNLTFDKQLAYDQQPIHPEDVDLGVVTRTETQGLDGSSNVIVDMPENVINSYAVYHSDKKSKFDPKYKTGKVFHIYRPKIVDDTSVEAWCDIDIDENKKELTLTIPQSFLDVAVYPITLDPTFGYTTLGGTDLDIGTDGTCIGKIGTSPGSEIIASLHVGLDEWTLLNSVKMALYTAPATFPNTGSLQSAQTVVRAEGHASAQFEIFSIDGILNVTAQDYAILAWAEASVTNIRRDSGSGVQSAYFISTYGTWPASPTLSSSTNNYSTFATYGVPIITGIGDGKFRTLQQDIDINCLSALASQGAGKVEVGDTNDYGTANLSELKVNSWSNTLINVDMDLGGLPEGMVWVYLTNDDSQTSIGFQIYVSGQQMWGHGEIGLLEATVDWCRTHGGTSPNEDNMILKGCACRVGLTHTSQVRLAVYSGGSLTTGPAGATLLKDFGLTSGSGIDEWQVLMHLGNDIAIPKSNPLWIAVKGNDLGFSVLYNNTFPPNCDFQSARGRYVSVAVSSDEAVAYPSTWPADTGTFASFWYNFYLLYAIKQEGYGMRFRAGNSDYLSSVSSFTPPTNCSVAFWIYPTNLGSRILGSDNLWEISFDLLTPSTGRIINDLFQGGANFYSNQSLNTEKLYHVVCTRASDNSGSIYINGIFDSTASTLSGSPPAATLNLGIRPGGTVYFDGYLQDVRIYNRVLAADEILTIYSCEGVDGIAQGLIHRWLLNEKPIGTIASGASSIIDIGTGSLNMTPTNTPEYSGSILKIRRFV